MRPMRVRLSWVQTHDVLEALYQAHLCDICEYDENMEVIPGTECEIQMLIKKFERIKNGAASEQGRRGGGDREEEKDSWRSLHG